MKLPNGQEISEEEAFKAMQECHKALEPYYFRHINSPWTSKWVGVFMCLSLAFITGVFIVLFSHRS